MSIARSLINDNDTATCCQLCAGRGYVMVRGLTIDAYPRCAVAGEDAWRIRFLRRAQAGCRLAA